MTVHRIYKKKFKGVTMKSGYIYTFRYSSWRNDPEPTLLLMYALDGIHPKTGHQWRFFQGINLTYIPRSMRRLFAQEWIRVFEKTKGNVAFTYELVKQRYPFMQHAIRRYFFKPNYYISNLKEVPFENMEEVIVSSWHKDFSKSVKKALLQKFSSAWKERAKVQKQAKKNKRKYGFFGRKI